MKFTSKTFFFIAILLISVFGEKSLTLYFFGSSTCGDCAEIKATVLTDAQQKYGNKLNIKLFDIDTDKGFIFANQIEEKFKITSPSPQELFFPDTFLLGYEDIMAYAPSMIEEYMLDSSKWSIEEEQKKKNLSSAIKKRLKGFTFWGITAAGIVDGINPCAIATMIFLISFLATGKRKKGEILVIGLAFTFAVFITYLLLGLGAFKALTLLKQYYFISEIVKWVAVTAAGVIAILSFYDAMSYKITGKTDAIKLQLPKTLKKRIRTTISGNLKSGSLIGGAIIAGFLVTLLEAVCTGQVYLPTIVLMTKEQEFKLLGWLYLVYYNILFVLPLLIVMVLAYYGLKWEKLAKMTQNNLTSIKILLGIVMGSLALFLALAG